MKRDIELTIGLMDLDLTLIEPKSDSPYANNSIANNLRFEKWKMRRQIN